jgi:hypothetical protein
VAQPFSSAASKILVLAVPSDEEDLDCSRTQEILASDTQPCLALSEHLPPKRICDARFIEIFVWSSGT